MRRIALFAVLLYVGIQAASAQTTEVQFIHASPYREVQRMDVYRDGVLWLDDFALGEATPFQVLAAKPLRLSFALPNSSSDSSAFYSENVILAPRDTMVVIASGDPLFKAGEPPFRLFVRREARKTSLVPELLSYLDFVGNSDFVFVPYGRGFTNANTGSEQLDDYYLNGYGTLEGYTPAPPFPIEVDSRAVDDLSLITAGLADFTGLGGLAISLVHTGFLDPPRPGDAKYTTLIVLPDGTVRRTIPNVAKIQFIHDSPYVEAERVALSVVLVDSIGPSLPLLHIDDFVYREATPVVTLPSGRIASGDGVTAPDLLISVTTADGADTLYSIHARLQFGLDYLSVLTGDPLSRAEQPAMTAITDLIEPGAVSDSGQVATLFFNGVSDAVGLTVGAEDVLLPVIGSLSFGSFGRAPVPRNKRLYLADASTRETLTLFDLSDQVAASGDSISAVVISGFIDRPGRIATEGSDLAVLVAQREGGPLVSVPLQRPPFDPFWILVGGFGIVLAGFVYNQMRVTRLRAREEELNFVVAERTKELLSEKQKTEAQALRLQELDEVKNRFFANISHEFRTPLTLILGPLQDGLEETGLATVPFTRRSVESMRKSARRLLRLINQLLDLSKLESGQLKLRKEPGDLVRFIRDLVRQFVPLAERRRITLRHDSNVTSLRCTFDPDALEKMFSNLLSNALKFTPEGGKVGVSLRQGEDGNVSVAVRDTGPGIEAEDMARIFNRFQQADMSSTRAFEGTGIGLALAKEMVMLHGGRLEVDSQVSIGTTFTVSLPVESASDAPESEHDVENARLEADALDAIGGVNRADRDDGTDMEAMKMSQGATVLVVEDNADVRAYLLQHLEDLYHVIEAKDGVEGLTLAEEHEPDLILSDVMMPRMDGYELTRSVKAIDALHEIPVLLLTAKADEASTVEGLQSGADDYLAKPFSVHELRERVHRLIQTRRELRASYQRELIVRPSGVKVKAEEETFVERVVEVVELHLGDTNLTVDLLANEVGMSRRQLSRRLAEVLGETPAELVRRLRLARASQLLRARAGTVAEVAYMVGFASPSSFTRAFKRIHGMSPSEHVSGRGHEEALPEG